MGVIFVMLLIAGVCFMIYYAIDSSQCSDSEKRHNEVLSSEIEFFSKNGLAYRPQYTQYKTDYGYRYECPTEITVFDDDGVELYKAHYWFDDTNKILYFMHPGRNKIIKISYDNIKLYAIEGTVQYIPHVESNGKSVSVGGAVVGAAIAGPAGMIVGATKDRNNITTRVEKKGRRDLVIYYVDENNVNRTAKVYESDVNGVRNELRRRIAEKDGEYIEKQLKFKEIEENNSNLQTQGNNDDIATKLKEIKDLFESGLINEEEYALKKKQLLDL